MHSAAAVAAADSFKDDIEKSRVEHIDAISNVNTSDTDVKQAYVTEFTPEEQRRIIHRIDRRLVATVGAMYCISLMDRTNLSAARIAGMSVELDMEVGYRYSIVTLVFFITYVLFQPPSTIIVRKIGPRIHLSAICVLWGACMIGMGFVHTWGALSGLRAILGILEAGFFPSSVYLLSTWYVRYDMGKRYSCFYIIGCVASAFAGILAYGLMQMDGLSNLGGWRWIFIIEGIITCLIGVLGYWLLVGFPDSAQKSWRFLTPAETAFIIARVNADRADATTSAFTLKAFFAAAKDVKIWLYALVFFNSTTITYALAFFLPVILRQNMGFSVGASQCLVAPPYAFAGLVMYAAGWAGDKYHLRGPVVLFNMALCIVGLPIMGFASSAAVRYFGVFLVTAGANSNIPAAMTYQSTNIRGQWKRAFCSATLVGFGGVGGIAGSLVFRSQDAPDYRPGIWACIACAVWNVLLVGVLSGLFWRANRRQASGEVLEPTGADDEGAGFRYTY